MGMVEFDYIVVGCPSCFGFLDNLAVDATAIFHEGVAGRWGDWIPSNGTCVGSQSKRAHDRYGRYG